MERVLDVYDDDGVLLAARRDVLSPALLRSSFLTKEAADALPDDLFALILVSGDRKLRKYACTDPANTEVSTLYFLHNFPSLAPNAVKVAARNLRDAREIYSLPPLPILDKLAETGGVPEGLGNVAEPVSGKRSDGVAVNADRPKQKLTPNERIRPTGPDTGSPEESKDRVNQLEELLLTYIEGRRLKTTQAPLPDRREPMDEGERRHGSEGKEEGKRGLGRGERKEADLTGTDVMPVGAKPKPPKLVRKLASAGNTVREDGPPSISYWLVGDLSERKVGPYPVDTLADLNASMAKFAEDLDWIDPELRPALARSFAQRADEIGVPVLEKVAAYASDRYRDAEELAGAILMREKLGAWLGKKVDYSQMAEVRKYRPAREYAEKLAALDRKYGFDRYWNGPWIGDPWIDTLALEKRATIVYSKGDVFVADKHLEWLAKHDRGILDKVLESDVVDEFVKNPVTVFESLPEPLKKTIGRLAMDRNRMWSKETS